jgi:hypothetical protein
MVSQYQLLRYDVIPAQKVLHREGLGCFVHFLPMQVAVALDLNVLSPVRLPFCIISSIL